MRLLSAKQYGVKLKATIQATGKLGFSKQTSDTLNLKEKKGVMFAQDETDNDTLYIILTTEESDDAFNLLCTNEYYTVNAKPLFEALGIDYLSQTVIFDLTRSALHDAELGGEAYKTKMRTLQKKQEKPMES